MQERSKVRQKKMIMTSKQGGEVGYIYRPPEGKYILQDYCCALVNMMLPLEQINKPALVFPIRSLFLYCLLTVY